MGRALYDWYQGLAVWQQAIVSSVAWATFSAILGVAVEQELRGALFFPFGLVIGLVLYVGYDRAKVMSGASEDEPPEVDDYPEALQAIERRHIGRHLILVPTLVIVGYFISLIVTGTGYYGACGGLLTAYLALLALARFGGPNDPKWKRVNDEWRQKHPELARYWTKPANSPKS
jgi:hypothetical protein